MNQITESEHKEGLREIVNVPNVATLVRLLIAGHVSYVLLGDGPSIGLGVEYASGMLLDAFDGWYARKFDQCTKFGKVFDPIVDFASFHLPLLAYGISHLGDANLTHSALPIGASIFIAARDISLFQQYLAIPKEERDGYHASRIGKIKTWVQMGTVSALIALPESAQQLEEWLSLHLDFSVEIPLSYDDIRKDIVEGGLLASIGFSLLSGFGYWKKIQEKVQNKEKQSNQ